MDIIDTTKIPTPVWCEECGYEIEEEAIEIPEWKNLPIPHHQFRWE